MRLLVSCCTAGVLPSSAARSFAAAMQFRVLPPLDDWVLRRMQQVLRVQPPRQAPLDELAAHLEAFAASVASGHAGT